MTAPAQTVRPLPSICAEAGRVCCPQCEAPAGFSCALGSFGTLGYHVARFAAVYRSGAITGADFTAVTDAATVFTEATIVFGDPDCRHLHSVQGPGCPWCAPAAAGGAR
jgi:hypothetical protein